MIRYICKKCGAVLYEYTVSKPREPLGTLTPFEIALIYNFICPYCGRMLNPHIDNPDWREHIIIKAKPTRIKIRRSESKRETKEPEPETRKIKGVTWISNTEFIINEL